MAFGFLLQHLYIVGVETAYEKGGAFVHSGCVVLHIGKQYVAVYVCNYIVEIVALFNGIGTAKANERSELTGAVSSLSLVVAGLLTAVIFPLVAPLL